MFQIIKCDCCNLNLLAPGFKSNVSNLREDQQIGLLSKSSQSKIIQFPKCLHKYHQSCLANFIWQQIKSKYTYILPDGTEMEPAEEEITVEQISQFMVSCSICREMNKIGIMELKRFKELILSTDTSKS